MSDKLENAIAQAKAQFKSIAEMLDAPYQAAAEREGWTGPHQDKHGATFFRDETDSQTWACATWRSLCESFDIKPSDHDMESAEQAIHDDALSVEVRGDWHAPGADTSDAKPSQYRILLCTGGPAVQIVGGLDQWCRPTSARLQCQDWFTPWTDVPGGELPDNAEDVLLDYAGRFWFGE